VNILNKDEPGVDKILGVIKDGVATVATRNPAEAAAYKQMVLDVASNVAKAAKEGGFLGIGGKLVSKEEEAALGAIASVLS
jgi:hypothetical protein